MPWENRKCEICGSTFRTYVKPSAKTTRTCSKKCLSKLQSKIFSGENNPAHGKTYRTKKTHPEWARKVSETHKRLGTNVGEKNGMKQDWARKKASESARKKFQNQDMRDLIARGVSHAWARGDFDNARVGQCEWHKFERSDGVVVKCQGLWELEFAKYLDMNGIDFITHPPCLEYVDGDGISRNYMPDFYLFDEGKYVDVKNPFYEKLHADKIQHVRNSNPDIILEVYGARKLRALGLELSGFSDGRKDM